jgi:Zn-dependent protease with chaperone function
LIEQYWFRALAVSFASFAVLYLVISTATSLAWRFMRRRESHPAKFLFALLSAPLLVSIALVIFLVIPAFVLFEPVRGDEPTSGMLLAFAVLGLVMVCAASVRAAFAWVSTAHSVDLWSDGAVAADLSSELPTFSTNDHSPAAVIAGIARPRLLISRSTSRALTTNELRLVVAHETEHARRRDNLRKLLLAGDFMPFRHEMKEEWMLACELAADRGAVANGYDACDLAAALVKVSRMSGMQSRLATNFAAATPAVLAMRVNHLISWEPATKSDKNAITGDVLIYAIAGLSLALLIYSGDLLRLVHRISEIGMN